MAALQEELAVAKEAVTLETNRNGARQRVHRLREGGSSLNPDPVAEALAWLSRGQLSVREIGFGFPLIFALFVEIVSAFGPAGIVAYAEATRKTLGSATQPDMAGSGEHLPAVAREGELGRVVNWMAENTEPTALLTHRGFDNVKRACNRSRV